jgi:hypothetical protein
VASTDDIVEDEADEHPGQVVKGGRRRDVVRAVEGDWGQDWRQYGKCVSHGGYPLFAHLCLHGAIDTTCQCWCKDVA